MQQKRVNKDDVSLSYRMSIGNVVAREILDSRGNPTVEVDLHTSKGWRYKWFKMSRVNPV